MHRIDSSDRRRYSQRHEAHDHLTIRSGDAMVYGANRLRPFEFVALFEKHGFEVLEFAPFERVGLDEKLRRRRSWPAGPGRCAWFRAEWALRRERELEAGWP